MCSLTACALAVNESADQASSSEEETLAQGHDVVLRQVNWFAAFAQGTILYVQGAPA